jgi:hypothetical protein
MAVAGGGGTLASAASAGGREVAEAAGLAGGLSMVWNLKRGLRDEAGFDCGAGSAGAAGSTGAPTDFIWPDKVPGRSRCAWR